MDLKETFLFDDLSPDEILSLEQKSTTVNYRKNVLLVSMGDESNCLYIILEGRVRIFRSDNDGKELTVATLGAGECFGELATLGDIPRSANAETITPCKLRTISKTDFQECMAAHPDMALRMISLLVDRLRATTDDVSSLALMDVYGRVVRVLTKHSVEKEGKNVVEGFSHREIATMIGSSREMVSRIFRDLRTGGYISTCGSTIILEKKLPDAW